MFSKKQEGRKDLVFGMAVEFKQQCLLFFKQGMIYFEWDVGNFGQAMSVPAVPLLTSLKKSVLTKRFSCVGCVQQAKFKGIIPKTCNAGRRYL